MELVSIFHMKYLNVDILEKRLRQRQTESEEKLIQRISKANVEMKYADNFDVVLVNDVLEKAKNQAKEIVTNYLSK